MMDVSRMCGVIWLIFFFFKQKTAYELRISDWSSDVCSSDLVAIGFADAAEREAASGDGHRHMARHGKRDDVADLEREQLDEADFGACEHRPHGHAHVAQRLVERARPDGVGAAARLQFGE